MPKTIVGLFDTSSEAEAAVRDLQTSGFSADEISVVANNAEGIVQGDGDSGTRAEETAGSAAVGGTVVGGGIGLLMGLGLLFIPGIGPVAAAGTLATTLGMGALGAGVGAATGGLAGALVGSGIPENEAGVYAEGVRRGGTLVMVDTGDDRAQLAVDALERNNPVDIERREVTLRESGWTSFDPNAEPYTAERGAERPTTPVANTTRQTNATVAGETVLPVIEEELTVGKREVERGRVRVHSRVTATPVEEQVRLREEHVTIERRPVDREVTAADADLFKEQQIELRETAEQAVVSKEARVVEEVVVDKEVEERVETVRDTVRRTDVDIEEGVAARGDYSSYSSDFRNYYTTNYANSGHTYEQYDPAFQYGYTLASDKRYHGKEWSAVEADARRSWEQHNSGSWEQFKDSIRYAWDRARGRA
ncbi:DUF2382 domain-containing protein [Candidatus Gracilibacteria bacterium]|nr:DUF2382 domain-containing protein [Candidatus Gracilibacteria bacterium]